MNLQKKKRWVCKQYTDWVKSLPSCLSMRPADDPHHIKGVLFTGSEKPHDLFTIPLVRDEHTELHHIGAAQWQLNTSVDQALETLKTINQALDEGLIEIKWVGKR